MYEKSDIVKGMMMVKDASTSVFTRNSPSTNDAPTLAEIQVRLERVRRKIEVLSHVAGQRRVH
jgi:hypothetical protein